ncbi:endonuclease/exonuclease/phosphatase family protein [Tautonia marina]|uniref:endonuclease/exonuclease/phosphatase family protein n=1 Tax=Tautonia marina TaxID=2653855 RepID=UPI001260E0BD|nr:endonuclease/exonuclease/phosphatase family protein [Tautonia marina]
MSQTERFPHRNEATSRATPPAPGASRTRTPDSISEGARGGLRRLVGGACWSYPILLAVVWAVQAILGDRWWPGTILLYGPRWFWGLPLGGLLPLALLLNRPAIRPLLFGTILLLGPVMGFVVPWRSWIAPAPQGPVLRVLTCNTQGLELDPEALGDLIDQLQPDVVALQEWSDLNREQVFRDDAWHYRTDRPGLGLASRVPIRSAEPLTSSQLAGRGFLVWFELDAPGGPIHLVNLHLETPRGGLEAVRYEGIDGVPAFRENIDMRWRVSKAARALIRDRGGPDVITGDFNLTADSPIFRRYWTVEQNAFGTVGRGFGATKYTRWFGARIDHVLTGPSWQPVRVLVGPDVGSDHRPLIVDLVQVGPTEAH